MSTAVASANRAQGTATCFSLRPDLTAFPQRAATVFTTAGNYRHFPKCSVTGEGHSGEGVSVPAHALGLQVCGRANLTPRDSWAPR